jgi:PAS domain S-box-containing protein
MGVSLAGRLFRMVFGWYLLLAILVTSGQLAIEFGAVKRQIAADMRSLAESFAPGAADALWTLDRPLLASIATGVAKAAAITGVRIVSSGGEVMAEQGEVAPGDPPAHDGMLAAWHSEQAALTLRTPRGETRTLGTLVLYSSRDVALARVKDSFIVILVNSLIKTAGLWLIFRLVITHMLARPLERITEMVNRFELGADGPPSPVAPLVHDELGRLAAAMQEMQARLQASHGELDRINRGLEETVAERTLTLRRSQALLQAIYDTSIVCIGLIDGDGVIIHANRSMAEAFATTPERLIGSAFLDFVDDGDREAARRELAAIAADPGTIVHAERRFRRVDGSQFWGLKVGQALPCEEGLPMGTVVAIADISDRLAAEADLKDLSQRLQRSNQELEHFAYVASHDLRQPLRMVTSYLTLIRKQLGAQLAGELGEYFAFAVDGAKRMDAMIIGLLEYSRIGRGDQAHEPVDLGALVERVLLDLGPAIADAGAEVAVAGPLPTVMGRVTELERLFQNLVGNAVKYRDPGRPMRVSIGAADGDGEWQLWIADTGIGIPADSASRIFDMFQRAVKAEDFEGTGIGLAVCRKIVEHHRGRIWAESEPGKGSTFRFTIAKVEG